MSYTRITSELPVLERNNQSKADGIQRRNTDSPKHQKGYLMPRADTACLNGFRSIVDNVYRKRSSESDDRSLQHKQDVMHNKRDNDNDNANKVLNYHKNNYGTNKGRDSLASKESMDYRAAPKDPCNRSTGDNNDHQADNVVKNSTQDPLTIAKNVKNEHVENAKNDLQPNAKNVAQDNVVIIESKVLLAIEKHQVDDSTASIALPWQLPPTYVGDDDNRNLASLLLNDDESQHGKPIEDVALDDDPITLDSEIGTKLTSKALEEHVLSNPSNKPLEEHVLSDIRSLAVGSRGSEDPVVVRSMNNFSVADASGDNHAQKQNFTSLDKLEKVTNSNITNIELQNVMNKKEGGVNIELLHDLPEQDISKLPQSTNALIKVNRSVKHNNAQLSSVNLILAESNNSQDVQSAASDSAINAVGTQLSSALSKEKNSPLLLQGRFLDKNAINKAKSKNSALLPNTLEQVNQELKLSGGSVALNQGKFIVSFRDTSAIGVAEQSTKTPNLLSQLSLTVKSYINSYVSHNNASQNVINIKLSPATLGEVNVEIISQSGSDNVSKIQSIKISAEKHETLHILEQSRIELDKSLRTVTGVNKNSASNAQEDSLLEFEMQQDDGSNKSGYFTDTEERERWMSQFSNNAVESSQYTDNSDNEQISKNSDNIVSNHNTVTEDVRLSAKINIKV